MHWCSRYHNRLWELSLVGLNTSSIIIIIMIIMIIIMIIMIIEKLHTCTVTFVRGTVLLLARARETSDGVPQYHAAKSCIHPEYYPKIFDAVAGNY